MTKDLLSAIEDLHVVVIGDVMIDRYLWGDCDRISPEAPVPIVNVRHAENRLGGAANVALNCKALGAVVSIASIVGMDEEGRKLRQLASEHDIRTDLLLTSTQRTTTVKTRILSKNQQMLRYDQEMLEELCIQDEHAFIDAVLRYLQIQKPQIVILEDYNKGLLKENVIQKILQHCRHLEIFVAVDPKEKNFFAYKGVDLFKPNLKEIQEGLSIRIDPTNIEALSAAHGQLKQQLEHRISLVTLSEKGMFYQKGDERKIVPSYPRRIADVSGAGDAVIAVASIIYYLSRDLDLMSLCANLAGGLVCEEAGVAPVNKNRFLEELRQVQKLK